MDYLTDVKQREIEEMGAWKDKFCGCGKDAELLHHSNGGSKYWCWKCWRIAFPDGLYKTNSWLTSK
jgi:hypothetical protein